MNNQTKTQTNADPITGEHGSHPVGTGLGAVGAGAVVGAAGGAIGGPVGAVVGAAVGAAAGAVAGHAAAEAINPTIEAKYWEGAHPLSPNATTSFTYVEFAPAYRYGWESFDGRTDATTFESLENDLANGWHKVKGQSRLTWQQAKNATRDAWNRVQTARRGSAKRLSV